MIDRDDLRRCCAEVYVAHITKRGFRGDPKVIHDDIKTIVQYYSGRKSVKSTARDIVNRNADLFHVTPEPIITDDGECYQVTIATPTIANVLIKANRNRNV